MRFYLLKSIFVLFLLVSMQAQAQHYSSKKRFNPKYRYHSIGFGLGTTNYMGDLDPHPNIFSPSLVYTRYNIGIHYMYKFAPRLSFRGNAFYGRIKGDDYKSAGYNSHDIYRKLRNLNFKSAVIELKADLVIDLFANRSNYRKRHDFNTYVAFGIAFFHFNPKGQTANGNWVALHPLSTEGEGIPGYRKKYHLNQIAIPLSIGFRYKLSRQWNLSFEVGYRITFTDYLDDVSGNYVPQSVLVQYRGQQAANMADKSNLAVAKDPKLASFVVNKHGGYVNQNNQPYNGTGYKYINSYNTPGAQRGKPNRDYYIVTAFQLTYIIPPRVICPKFRK